jgi:hypothetical protein
VYLEGPGGDFLGRELRGSFAHLEHDTNNKSSELRMVLDLGDGPGQDFLVPVVMILTGHHALQQALVAVRNRDDVSGCVKLSEKEWNRIVPIWGSCLLPELPWRSNWIKKSHEDRRKRIILRTAFKEDGTSLFDIFPSPVFIQFQVTRDTPSLPLTGTSGCRSLTSLGAPC